VGAPHIYWLYLDCIGLHSIISKVGLGGAN
jgi:hypothetical protein